MRSVLVTHPSSWEHVSPGQHPERPERVDAAIEGVLSSDVEVVRVEARSATNEELLGAHGSEFLDELQGFCDAGGGSIDPDTYAVERSWEAARFAAGAGLTAIEAIDRGDADVGFAVVRPPGHHAERDRTMGFCLINNVAVSAAALARRGQRVAIVDWDVHHGNGTQEIFLRSPDVLYISLHHSPFYPGTGRIQEVGKGLGIGATVNLPILGGSDGSVYRQAFSRIVLPILEQFGPDWLLVSAGYDGHVADPLGGMALTSDDYRVMAAALGEEMHRTNTVFFLEGGYDLGAIRDSTKATLDGFSSGVPLLSPPEASDPGIDHAVEVLSLFWDVE
ncbi:MAG: histone deacetylase [Actinomycetota bacterium]|nr:histone deacetylase [Actinomycetota bacterium]